MQTYEKELEAENVRLRAAIDDVRPHVDAWVSLLTAHVHTLLPDMPPTPGCDGRSDRSYAEHELYAMKRDLAALLAAAS